MVYYVFDFLYFLFLCIFFFFNDTATTEIYTLSLHDALPIWPRPSATGWTSAAPGAARTRSTSEASIGPRGLAGFESTLVALRTTAPVSPVTLVNRVSKLARRVSPSTSVPARKATPSSTARKVPARRRLWLHRPLRVIASMVDFTPRAT